jgi:hypothetical protein
MPTGIRLLRCSSYIGCSVAAVLLLVVLRWKELEAGGDASATSPSIKHDWGSPDRAERLISSLLQAITVMEEKGSVDLLPVIADLLVLKKSAAIFRSTLWEAHHQGTDTGVLALPLLTMAEWRLFFRCSTSI